MKTKPLSFQEGVQRGQQDRAANMSYDPYRWAKAWADLFYRFEQGYDKGYNS